MTTSEFSNEFDTLISSYSEPTKYGHTLSNLVFDEYEKSVFLTKAEQDLIVGLYSGKISNEAFETTEEQRRYLDSLIKTKTYDTPNSTSNISVSDDSVFYTLPSNIAFITLEQIIFNDNTLGCFNGSRANVMPITHDEYNKVKDNPFRGPTRYKALRLDYGNNEVEIISKYKVGKYLIKYVEQPSPIVLVNLPDELSINGVSIATDCKLHPLLHRRILEMAVREALISRGSQVKKE